MPLRAAIDADLDAMVEVVEWLDAPVVSETLAGVAILTVPADQARELMAADPCVRAGMMRCEVHLCHGFPGDSLP